LGLSIESWNEVDTEPKDEISSDLKYNNHVYFLYVLSEFNSKFYKNLN
jgi:hypothetical protein